MRHRGRRSTRSVRRIQPRRVQVQRDRRRGDRQAGGDGLSRSAARGDPQPGAQFLFQHRRPFHRRQQPAAGQAPGRRGGLGALRLQQQLRAAGHSRRGLRHGHREAQRGFRPDPGPLGSWRRSVSRAADSGLEHAARRRRHRGRHLYRSGRRFQADQAAQFRGRAAPGQRARRSARREPHPGGGGARQVRIPARRLPAAPQEPDL